MSLSHLPIHDGQVPCPDQPSGWVDVDRCDGCPALKRIEAGVVVCRPWRQRRPAISLDVVATRMPPRPRAY
jgi:hypothetical protein